jgi:hypothetical protein
MGGCWPTSSVLIELAHFHRGNVKRVLSVHLRPVSGTLRQKPPPLVLRANMANSVSPRRSIPAAEPRTPLIDTEHLLIPNGSCAQSYGVGMCQTFRNGAGIGVEDQVRVLELLYRRSTLAVGLRFRNESSSGAVPSGDQQISSGE